MISSGNKTGNRKPKSTNDKYRLGLKVSKSLKDKNMHPFRKDNLRKGK